MKKILLISFLSFLLSQDYSLSFDGNDYVNIENISAYNNLNNFTISLNFKTEQSHPGASLVINED